MHSMHFISGAECISGVHTLHPRRRGSAVISSAGSRSVHYGSVPDEGVRYRPASIRKSITTSWRRRRQWPWQPWQQPCCSARSGLSSCWCPQRVRRPWPATSAIAQCAIAVRPNWVGCYGSLAFFGIMNDLDCIVARCPQHGATHSVQWVWRTACARCILFVALCMVP